MEIDRLIENAAMRDVGLQLGGLAAVLEVSRDSYHLTRGAAPQVEAA
ncbi:hypothetical protein [Nocardia neocaledoniensis]|nr:hypothetical protein [Nocardia neocaledoniensis]